MNDLTKIELPYDHTQHLKNEIFPQQWPLDIKPKE